MPVKKVSKAKAAKKKAAVPKRAAKVMPSKAAASKAAVPAKGAIAAIIPNATQVQFTGNGRGLLVARAKKKTLTLFDIETASETPPLPAPATFSAVALAPDNRFLATGTSTGILAVQSTQTGKTLWKSKADGVPIGRILFSLDGTYVFAAPPAPDAEELKAARLEAGKQSEEKKKIDAEGWIRVHRTATGEVDPMFSPVANSNCCHMALSPEGLFLAHSELNSNAVLVWHLPTRQISVVIRLPQNRGPIKSIAFGVTVRHLYIAQQTQTTGWNAENGTQLLAIETPGMQSIAMINHGDAIAATRVVEDAAELDLYGAETGHLRKTVKLAVKGMGALSASPDGAMLALPTAKDCFVCARKSWRGK